MLVEGCDVDVNHSNIEILKLNFVTIFMKKDQTWAFFMLPLLCKSSLHSSLQILSASLIMMRMVNS